MDIQPIVIGTAGHIDHGKSTLVRGLTGVDPDRLKEERERGLTIDLGFAPLELPDGRKVGIVDVPGHEKFIRNMAAGASGIDLVVLVVAADDGVMPQTTEHLQIMELLGVRRGFIALTKIDLVDEDLVDLAEEDVVESVAGTFLEGAPVLRVSGRTGEGMEALRDVLFSMAAETEPRPADGVFRMPIQRVFSKQGLGTVVTGIPVSGRVRPGDVLEVLPNGGRGKVRGIQAYRESADEGRAGHSTALNLSDVERSAVTRGDVVCTPNFFTPRRMVAARLTTLAGLDREVENRMRVRLHTGTADPAGEIVLLDVDTIPPGGSGLVQLRLDDAVVCAPGDRFVLRQLTPVVTLGGGVILEESRYRLKRFKGFVLEELARAERSLDSPAALLESVLARTGDALATTDELAHAVKLSRDETARLLEGLAEEGRVLSPKRDAWLHGDVLEERLAQVRAGIEAWFAEAPHRLHAESLDLRTRTGLAADLLAILLEHLAERGEVELLAGGRIRVPGREEAVDPALAERANAVAERLTAARFQPPSPDELAGALGLSAEEIGRVLEHLVDRGLAERIAGDLHLASACFEEARQAVVANCESHGHLEIPELRDALGTSRKFLIPILEALDARGVTLRQGGHRVLKRR